jgi:hypothetical protein
MEQLLGVVILIFFVGKKIQKYIFIFTFQVKNRLKHVSSGFGVTGLLHQPGRFFVYKVINTVQLFLLRLHRNIRTAFSSTIYYWSTTQIVRNFVRVIDMHKISIGFILLGFSLYTFPPWHISFTTPSFISHIYFEEWARQELNYLRFKDGILPKRRKHNQKLYNELRTSASRRSWSITSNS